MSKVMDTTPLLRLLGRIAGEYRARASIYDIPEKAFRETFDLEASSPGIEVMGARVSLPVGPAAGPHSQIAPNLVASWLCGARVFELKTVQEKDRLEIEKPCILALDEGHNTEWSTELSLEEAREEYLRGWIAINLLGALWSRKPREFVFNMSVGYTLDGIRGPRVDAFMEGMRRPERTPFWDHAMRDLASFVASPGFADAFGPEARDRVAPLLKAFPNRPVHSVTLSTMHGCPPEEIGRIGRYLIEEKGFDVSVKLNPTLLGYDEARRILDATGWEEVTINRPNFEHDLQWKDALALVAELSAVAEDNGRRFGVKLSNTLANANDGSFLPGAERYMSGRALYPLTVRLAARLAEALPGFPRRFSFCGGVSAHNARELASAGLGPLTLATEILKPGGYLRMIPVARETVAALAALPPAAAAGEGRPDAAAIAGLAAEALLRPEYRKEWKGGEARIEGSLPLLDCFAAPCVEACPVRQKVPEYLRLAAAGRNEESLALILADNPLPCVTGTLCDHVCQTACSRNDYEGSVEIRGVKLAAAHAGAALREKARPAPAAAAATRVAVIGAGPAGLACAKHLALAGIAVTVFDADSEAGGVPANVIPPFRIPREDLRRDIARIEYLGVRFRFGEAVSDPARLRAEGFTSFFLAVGAPAPRPLPLAGEGVRVVDALEFLAATRKDPDGFKEARNILVVGGGNTAMDAVRQATRLPKAGKVRLSYRRTRREMPADREELENAVDEAWRLEGGSAEATREERERAILLSLSLPERLDPPPGSGAAAPGAPGKVTCRRMRLGEKDASGRRAPLPSEETMTIDCDLLVAAVGEGPDTALLSGFGLALGKDGRPVHDPATQESSVPGIYVGGDAARGPSSIIGAEADGRRAAHAIMAKAGIVPPVSGYAAPAPDAGKLAARGEILAALPESDRGFVSREAERCLACDSACLRCVEVCPNRANTIVKTPGGAGMAQAFQILHVDALCNECGNCGVFCPWAGEPYKGKPTLFASAEALRASSNAGFAVLPAAGGHGAAVGAGGTAASGQLPSLLLRELPGAAPRELPPSAWATGTPPSAPLSALARALLDGESWLIGGHP
jgi:putative selenate reductase